MNTARLIHGDCLSVLPTIDSASIDAVVTDPPYPCIKRAYGTLSESEWHDLMRSVVKEVRRVLKPNGSAMFLLQPNCEHIGRMRTWLWEFMVWAAKEWNIIQDAYWWNFAAMPVSICTYGQLLRPSLKTCVWLGNPDCYRDQVSVLWEESDRNRAIRANARCDRTTFPSGHSIDRHKMQNSAVKRGGVTPFNVIPFPNSDSTNSSGAYNHPAGTPVKLCEWWIKYICPINGTVLDPFAGASSVGVACQQLSRNYVGIEKREDYVHTSNVRLGLNP